MARWILLKYTEGCVSQISKPLEIQRKAKAYRFKLTQNSDLKPESIC